MESRISRYVSEMSKEVGWCRTVHANRLGYHIQNSQASSCSDIHVVTTVSRQDRSEQRFGVFLVGLFKRGGRYGIEMEEEATVQVTVITHTSADLQNSNATNCDSGPNRLFHRQSSTAHSKSQPVLRR